MVKLDVVHELNANLVKKQPFVAVFFGGTGRIGHMTIRAFTKNVATNGGTGLRVYVVGRSAKTTEEIFAETRQLYPQGQYKFVKIEDLSLMSEIDRACAEIIQLEEKENQNPRIDYLMLSQGGSIFLPRIDTKEGLDGTMALMYYSRIRAITKLLPLLLKSSLPAKVVSVYAGGFEQKLYPDDLSLRDPSHYSYSQARSHMVYFHTLVFEHLAEQYRGKLALVHIFPGLVIGPGFKNPGFPLWFRIVFNYIVLPLFGRFITVNPDESGQRMMSLASLRYPPKSFETGINQDVATGTDNKVGSGAYALGWNGESSDVSKKYANLNKDELRKKVWAHTTRAFEVIEKGEVFTE